MKDQLKGAIANLEGNISIMQRRSYSIWPKLWGFNLGQENWLLKLLKISFHISKLSIYLVTPLLFTFNLFKRLKWIIFKTNNIKRKKLKVHIFPLRKWTLTLIYLLLKLLHRRNKTLGDSMGAQLRKILTTSSAKSV